MPKILIVDDDNDFAGACEALLTREGYEVVLANTVAEAEELITKGGLSLVLLDIMMEKPDDGISLAHKLNKEGLKIPIIMLSGVSKVTGYDYKCSEMLPCLEFLEKPVKPEVLISKVKGAIGK